eukprot:TRINITY_DN4080_c0_g1_i1.p1 TRINITY_DN4080_c0_g1~~TRINITY_DN4080_c0_g1_i1.p1  ORF type:complete len:785 (+),score=127.32 TRINITY_DN4080_c0_g1_i1:192-2546(+)
MTSDINPAKYCEVVKLILDNFRYAIKYADYFEDPSSWARVITRLLIVTRRLIPTLKQLILEEFKKTEASGGGNFSSVLRGNDFTTKIIAKLVSLAGSDYLRLLLGDLIAQIVLDKDLDLEVDPSRLSMTLSSTTNLLRRLQKAQEDIDVRQKLLIKKAQLFLDRIVDPKMVKQIPRDFRIIASYLAECARQYAPAEILPIIGGFVMLRFISAAIAAPESFNLLPHNKTSIAGKERRNLVLIAKFLQNLSNSVAFGEKEEYLSCMNKFIAENQKKMNDYLLMIIEDANTDYHPDPTLELSNFPVSELVEFHRLLHQAANKSAEDLESKKSDDNIDAMKAAVLKERELRFIKIVNDLGPPPTIPAAVSPRKPLTSRELQPTTPLLASSSTMHISTPHPMTHSHSLSSLRLPSFRSRRRRSGGQQSSEEPSSRDVVRHRTSTEFSNEEQMKMLEAVKNVDVLQLLQAMKDLDIDSLVSVPVPECVSPVEDTWLHIAAGSDNAKFMGFLLKASGLNVNVLSKELWSPLHVAAQAGNLHICELLLKEGASIHLKNNTGALPIHYFVTHNFSKRVNFDEVRLFRIIFQQLSNNGKLLNEVTNSQETPLHYACTRVQSEDNVILLLRNNADCNMGNKRGHTPLHICIMNRRKQLVKLLLENGARQDLACTSGTCAELAAGDEELLRLLESYSQTSIAGLDGLMDELIPAAESNNLEKMAALLAGRAFDMAELPPPSGYSSDHKTWLHHAVSRGNRKLVDILLATNNLDVNVRSANGWFVHFFFSAHLYFEI